MMAGSLWGLPVSLRSMISIGWDLMELAEGIVEVDTTGGLGLGALSGRNLRRI